MSKPKPASSSAGPGANTHHSGHSNSSISNNAPKLSDKPKNTPSNIKNNNVIRVDRNSSTASSVSVGGGNPNKRPSSASSQTGTNEGGINQNSVTTNETGESPQSATLTPSPQKSITSTSKPTSSNTSIKSNGNGPSVTLKSTGGGNNANTSINKPVGSSQKPSTVIVVPKPTTAIVVPKPTTAIVVPKPTTAIVVPKPKIHPHPIPKSPSHFSNNLSRSLQIVSLQKCKNFRESVEKAINDRKIFACCGSYPAVRRAMKKRGWVEKRRFPTFSRSANAMLPYNSKTGGERPDNLVWKARMLKDYEPDFVWIIGGDNVEWKNKTKDQVINRFPKVRFTTKVGLAECLQHMHWFSEAGVADTFFPRCYRLCMDDERQAFQDDYRLTACISYLRYFVNTFEKKGHAALTDIHSKIAPMSVDFASRQLGNYIRMRRHEDIDWLLPPNLMTQHWDTFIRQYYAVVHEKKGLRFDGPNAVQVKYEAAKKMVHKVAPYWPQIQMDGVFNMWICKPGARCRGKGIVIMNNLEKIMGLMTQSNFRSYNWVVQKYIERPMLIYKTKFDIRQWFLITDWTPLTVWFYKDSYIRLCTKPFILENFHESIHLCNNAIQCRYQNAKRRDSNLPDENMWSSDTFQTYLKTLGRLDAWPLICSKMKQAIVGVMLASQENVSSKRGCFELYGADFMLTNDFQPWLIEINSCPSMAASTSVTARMCAQCLEDTIKVVVDRRHNRDAETGRFELIYRQNSGSAGVQQVNGHDLTIIGQRLTRDINWPMTMSKSFLSVASKHSKSQHGISQHSLSSQSHNNNNGRRNQSSSINVQSASKQTLPELLQKLRVRNQEMFQEALVSQLAKTVTVFMETAKASKTSSGTSGEGAANRTNSELNGSISIGTDNKHTATDASVLDIYRPSVSSVGLQEEVEQDLKLIKKKLTGDVDWLITAATSAAINHPKCEKEESPISQPSQGPSNTNNNNNNSTSSNPPVDSNKQQGGSGAND